MLVRHGVRNRSVVIPSIIVDYSRKPIFIDRVAGEIIRLVASVCVRVSVCCGHSPV